MSRKTKTFAFLSGCLLASSAFSLASIDLADKTLKRSNVSNLETPEIGEVINFNYDWKFSQGDITEASDPEYNDESWRTLNLPHDWSIEQDFDSSIPAAMGKLPAGIGWYRKTFTVPEEYKNKEVYINFDGAYMNSTVYLNGQLLGDYPYGYTPFSYKMSDNLNYGIDEINTISVRIDSPLGNGRNSSRWYAGAGINRDVTISVDEPVHFVKDGIQVKDSIAGYDRDDFRKVHAEASDITKPDTKNVKLDVSAEVTNTEEVSKSAKLRISLLDYYSNEVVEEVWETTPVAINPNTTAILTDSHTLVNEVKLWSTLNPNLYNVKVEAIIGEEVVDSQLIRYGFRNIVYTKKGFYLNGEYTKLQGACMHHDQGSLGAVSYFESVSRQMRIMKDMGVNAVRTSHNTPTSQFLRACDEQGIMVMTEFFDTWTTAKNSDDYHLQFDKPVPIDGNHMLVQEGDLWSDYDARMSVRRDRNCPSIIMYSVGNEIYDTNNGDWSVNTVKRLIQAVRDADTTKAITMGFPMWHGAGSALDNYNSSSAKVADELDLVGLNYPGSQRYEKYGNEERYKDWIVFGSENSSAWKSRGVFSIKNGYMPNMDRQISSLDLINHFATQTDELNWDRKSEYSLGQFIWTGFDYIGEPQPFDSGANSAKSSYYGSVDTAGFPKAEYYMLKSQWVNPEDEPFVKIVNHTNVDDINLRKEMSLDDGTTYQLWVSSNCKSVALYVKDPVTGEEELIDHRDWNQDKILGTHGTNSHLNLQQPEGNPNGFGHKLYQIFTINYEETKGKQIIARAYDRFTDEKELGNAVATDIVNYSKGAKQVKLTPEKVEINADGQALSYITVDITDEDGYIDPNANNEVYFDIKGDGEILGVDNGDPTSMERYKAGADGVWKRSAFMGKALVIVRSTRKAGSFTLTARSSNLATGETTVKTVNPDESQSIVSEVAETVSFIAKVGITKEELISMLPNQVNVIDELNNIRQEVVIWNTESFTDSDLSHDNEIHIKGVIPSIEGLEANCIVTITGQVNKAIQSLATTTSIDVAPTLPNKAYLIDNKGNSTYTENIVWEAVNPKDYSYVGTFKVKGTVKYDGKDIAVYCLVRVVDLGKVEQVEDTNVALNGKVDCSYSEGAHTPDQLTNGVLGGKDGWGNWQNHDILRNDDHVTINFASRSVVDSASILFMGTKIDHAWFTPDSVKVEYRNDNGDFVEVTNVQGNALGRDGFKTYQGAGNARDFMNLITFDKVTTSALRFTFHIDNIEEIPHENNGDNTMLKVSEIEVNGHYDPLGIKLSGEAILGSLKVDGQEIDNFSPFTNRYVVALKQGQEVPTITATAALNGRVTVLATQNPYGKTIITVISEDGRVSQTYTIQYVVVE